MGWIDPGPHVVIEAFLEHLGPQGTLAVPTLVPAGQGIRPLFDVASSPSEMGLLTELLRKWPGAVRSDHPTHSIAAVGARATELCADHRKGWGPNTPWGTDALGYNTPWDRLRAWDAWIMMLGVSFRFCTLLHHVQVRYLDAHKGVAWKDPWPVFDFEKMGQRLAEDGIVTSFKLGQAQCLLARAGSVVQKALDLLEKEEETFFGSAVKAWAAQRRKIGSVGRTKAAVFKVNVTPDRCGKEIGRPLHMRGLILEHPQTGRAAHVVWDHAEILAEDGDPIRKAISEAAQVPFEKVLLTATHTHSHFWWPFFPHPEYREFVIGRIQEPIRQAASRMEEVRAGWRTIAAPGIARNRTVYLKDGRAYTERWSIPSTWHVPQADIAHRGQADDELRILVLERLDGTRLAVALNFSCHNSAGGGDPRISDDFFGVAAQIVENAEGCLALVSPGSQADQDPTAMIELGGDRTALYAKRLGAKLAGYALTALAEVPMHDLYDVSAASCRVEVTVREQWKPLAEQSGSEFFQRRARQGKDAGEVSVLAIGDYAMVGIPAELFTGPARIIRDHSPFAITSVMCLTNGQLLYIADKAACYPQSMIYGAENDLYVMAEPGSDTIFVKAGIEMLRAAREPGTLCTEASPQQKK